MSRQVIGRLPPRQLVIVHCRKWSRTPLANEENALPLTTFATTTRLAAHQSRYAGSYHREVEKSAAETVRDARSRASLSQRELAARSGVRQPNIAAIEAGRTQPTQATLDRLLHAAAVRPSLVLDRFRAEVRSAIERAGGRSPRVIGSVALGNDTEQSDLDLLVDLGDELSIWTLASLAEELRELLGTEVDIIDDHGSTALLEQVRAEAVSL